MRAPPRQRRQAMYLWPVPFVRKTKKARFCIFIQVRFPQFFVVEC
ncbi:hypothetical protein CSC28_0519 [Pseudomonas paraeruginosa]|nr:hypothetical protein CSC28_0519 [Pseudomonas paraeruginosa]